MKNKDNISKDEMLEAIYQDFLKAFKLSLPLAEAQEKVIGEESAFTQIAANVINACVTMVVAGSKGSQPEKIQAFFKNQELHRKTLNMIFDMYCDNLKRAVEFHNNENKK